MTEKIFSLIEEVGLVQKVEQLLAISKPSIRLDAVLWDEEKEEEPLMVGESKFGGLPDLPASLSWPANGEEHLAFLAQINLGDVVCKDKKCQLPPQGMLYFFYDIERQPWGFDPAEKDSWRVMYYDGDPAVLKQADLPSDLDEEVVFDEFAVKLKKEWTIPPFDSMEMEELEFSEDELDGYYDLIDKSELEFEEESEEESRLGRMLGYPDQIQGNMQVECELVDRGYNLAEEIDVSKLDVHEIEETAHRWVLLMQIESCGLTEMMWGDEGRVYFWIKKEDLVALRFDQVRLILQSY